MFHSSTLLHVSLHPPSGNPAPALSSIMRPTIFQQAVRLGSNPPKLIPAVGYTYPSSLVFGVQWFTDLQTHAQMKWLNQNPCYKYKHFPDCNCNLAESVFDKWEQMPLYVIMLNRKWCELERQLSSSLPLSLPSFTYFASIVLQYFFLVHKNQESLQHWKL